MYGQFVREMSEQIDKDLSWKWLVQGDLKMQTEATVCAAQDQALRANYTKSKIDKTSANTQCRMCGERGETVQHVILECEKLLQCEYKRRHEKFQNWSIGNCVRTITLKEERSGMSIPLKEMREMIMLN